MATGIRKKIIATMTMKPATPTVCGFIARLVGAKALCALSISTQRAAGSVMTMPAIISAQCTSIGIERSGDTS